MLETATGNTVKPLLFLLEGKKDLVIAELGVFFGNATLYILRNCSVKKYYAIDLWEVYDDYTNAGFGIPQTLAEYGSDKCFKMFMENVKDYHQVVVIKESTHEAHKHIEDGELDFCFIDANHAYDYVYKDIELWLPKVKKGGIICGHDYHLKSVNDAVNDFFKDTEYKVSMPCEWQWWWWVKK